MSGAPRRLIMVDGNEAAASVAYRTNEVIAIYPITPASAMGELSDEWASRGHRNVWGTVPEVSEMQSEAGAAGAVHGALQAGALTTTFTASQGLLLMIPNLYKVAGELTGFCMHVAARTIATHALSIFGDHADVMACRQTGMAMLCSGSVQEAHDFALIGQAAALASRVPVLHFFDGFRTSHEINRIEELADDDLRALLPDALVRAHRDRALTPDRPVLRGAAQNPDTFFQAREAANPFYLACPGHVQDAMDRLAERTGRRYGLFEYHGHPEAERVIVLMGSGAEAVHETVDWLLPRGERVGVVRVRLYRPFDVAAFAAALPPSVRSIAVLDRCKEPGAVGEPLYLDVVAALQEIEDAGMLTFLRRPRVVGGRYGISSKEFTPAMVHAVFEHLRDGRARNHFTVGITDDVTALSLPVDPVFDIEPDDVGRALFYGLGSDGTVGSNKASIKIIGEGTPNYAQAYFVYDSKKSGSVTVSHLRVSPRPIRSTYRVQRAQFVACHHPTLLERLDVLECAAPGGTLLLNTPHAAPTVWETLPREVQEGVTRLGLRVFAIDGSRVAREAGLGQHISTVMQACFFAISGVLPAEEGLARVRSALEKTYAKKGREVIRRNLAVVDEALRHLHEVEVGLVAATRHRMPPVLPEAPDLVQRVTGAMLAGRGDLLPVSAFPPDGTWPTATSRWEKRNLAAAIPIWDPAICIQCNKCALACPHAAIRAKVYDPAFVPAAPEGFRAVGFKGSDHAGTAYTIQVAPEDCTGCGVCIEVCPARDKSNPRHKAIDLLPYAEHVDVERRSYDFFLALPDPDRSRVALDAKGSQFLLPLFEYSGACAGCGETPYVKLLTQLFGDRLLVANATGCSSIYGGNLPTTPYAVNGDGRGPAWSNSLFEDNAEFGFGFRLALDTHERQARQLLGALAPTLGEALVTPLLEAPQGTDAELAAQRERVALLKAALAPLGSDEARRLLPLADYLVRKSVWLVGGDGWAYDIGFGGLDHVLASGRNVNVLVLDTEVYSNTGGQQSKATPIGAAAKFAAAGKETPKKDLGLLAMAYGSVYVARVAFGAKDAQTVKALVEAESYPGPSLVIAYSHCIAHGYDMARGPAQQKLAVDCGIWPLYRFDPRRAAAGEPPLHLDADFTKGSVRAYMANEGRFQIVEKLDPERYARLVAEAEWRARERHDLYEQLARIAVHHAPAPTGGAA